MQYSGIEQAGFAIVPGFLAPEIVDRFLREVHDLSPARSRAGIRHALRLAPVAALAQQREMIGLARSVLGEHAFPFRATIFDKSPESNWLVVWHQDTALPLKSRKELSGWGPWSVKDGIAYAHAPESALTQIVALRLSLDDSTVGNGPLRVLPRTHKLGLLDDDKIHEIASRTKAVECVASKGGVVMMRPLLIHGSSKSISDLPRRVLHIEYASRRSIVKPLELATA